MRYLGALGVLAECSPYVPEDVRQQIERAMSDAVAANPHLEYRRILDRLEIEVKFGGPLAVRGAACSGTKPPRVLRKKKS